MQAEAKKDTITMLSESSPVRLGLALAMCGGCVVVYTKLDNTEAELRRELSANYVSRDLFSSEMAGLRREFDLVRSSLSELKVSVAAAQADAAKSR